MIKKYLFSYINGFFLQLTFLTRIPLPLKLNYNPTDLGRGMIFSPITGLIIGSILYIVYFMASFIGYHQVSIIMVLFTDLIITGGLHYDGLADTCDGVFSGRDRDRMLEIMKDSRIGTNGVLAVVFALLFKYVFLSLVPADKMFAVLMMITSLARAMIVVLSSISEYAGKSGGLGEQIVAKSNIISSAIVICVSIIILYLFCGFTYIVILPFLLLFIFVVGRYFNFKLKGITGDVMGAVIVVSEIFILICYIVFLKFAIKKVIYF